MFIRIQRFFYQPLVVLGLLFIVVSGLTIPNQAVAEILQIGQPAPAFSLPDQDGKEHRLSDYQGNWLVLYFYHKNGAPGCTTEACNFSDELDSLASKKAKVLGVSLDSVSSHKQFSTRNKLRFPILSDIKGEVAKAYGSLLDMTAFRMAKRHTVIINPEGKIAKVYRQVDPDMHVYQVLEDLASLQLSKS